MKFKYKVLIVNILVLSVSLGFTGYLMIRQNFRLALDTLVKNAVVANNLAQSSVEYDLLNVLNKDTVNLNRELATIGQRTSSGMISSDTTLFIHYNGKFLFDENHQQENIPQDLVSYSTDGAKKYCISQEGEEHFIYVSSCNEVRYSLLHIITKRSIEDAYVLMEKQTRFFNLLLLLILFLGSVLLFILSSFLTKPLEKLNYVSEEMAGGNYKMRSSINSNDEIGQLADKFNHMAASVENHVEELHQQIRRREQFVADFTHEIKTPMTTIIGYSDTMRSIELPREEQIDFLNYIYSAGKRLEIMSQKLFELIYLNQHDIPTTPVNTLLLKNEIEMLVSPALSTKQIHFCVDIKEATLLINKDLLTSAFINFIDNSRKASDEGSTITFEGKILGNNYVFKVIDKGIGIHEDDIKRICDEFYMVDKSRSRKEGSAGLGLSLASLIIDRHQAQLEIESKEGEGTTISVIFPPDCIVNK